MTKEKHRREQINVHNPKQTEKKKALRLNNDEKRRCAYNLLAEASSLVACTAASFRESDAASVIVVLSPTLFSVVRFCLNDNNRTRSLKLDRKLNK